MSPRRSSHAAWGVSTEERSIRQILIGSVVVLLVGILIGWLVGHESQSTPKKLRAAASSVIDPTVVGVTTADKTENGAVKAATAFVNSIPDLSLKTSDVQQTAINSILSPTASSSLGNDIATVLQSTKAQLQGTGTTQRTTHTEIVNMPITYKVDMSANKAHVVFWYVSVAIEPDTQTAESTWTTADMQLTWTDHWRIASLSSTLGPTPPLYAPNAVVSGYSDVLNVFSGFQAYHSAVN